MSKELQKKLHEEYKEELKLAWNDPKMVEFCTKQAEIVVKTSDGYYLEVEKKSIKKDFCFGYGYCGVSNEEEQNNASEMAQHTRENANYFIKENLDYYNSWINEIEKYGAYISKGGKYYGQKENCLLRNFTSGRRCDWWNDEDDYEKMSEKDTQNLLDAFKEAKENMMKRLNVYLKKYGLKNLNVWTYLVD